MLGGGVWWEEEKNSVLGPNSKFASGSPFQGQKGVVVQTKAFICKTRNVKKKKKIFGGLLGEKGVFLLLFVLLTKSHRVGRIQDRV